MTGNRFETVRASTCLPWPRFMTRLGGTRMTRKYTGKYTAKNRPRLYWTWYNMIRRCENPKAPDYYRYGALGIAVCEKWHDLENFLDWAYSHGWKEGLTLDRIDNEEDYCPENCRWADRFTQANNRRDNKRIMCEGESLTVPQISRKYGIKKGTLYCRLDRGWANEDIVFKPVKSKKKRIENGV